MPLDLGRELIIDNFAGGGGTSTGLEAAFGRPVDIAINWRLLKDASTEMGVPAIDVFDQNYGTVKAYHASVWMAAYAVSINPQEAA